MKKTIFAAFIFFATTNIICAQINLINSSLIIPDSNTAFIGVQNVFEILNTDKARYTLKANSSSIQPAEKINSFIVNPHSVGVDTFHVIKNGKPVYSKVFTLSFLPPLQATLGSLTKDVASKEEIIANKGLLVKACNFRKMGELTIISFILKIKSNNIKEGEESIANNGNLLTEKAISVIKSLTHNDVVTFDDIKAHWSDSRTITLPSFSITIK